MANWCGGGAKSVVARPGFSEPAAALFSNEEDAGTMLRFGVFKPKWLYCLD